MADTSHLAEVVEEFRQRHFPDLDSALVASVLRIHAENVEDEVAARRQTEEEVRSWVKRSLDS